MILGAGTDCRRCCIQTACPSSLQMTLELPPAPSCRQKPVPLGHSGEEEETGVHVSALCSAYPQAAVLPEVSSPVSHTGRGVRAAVITGGHGTLLFGDFTRSVTTKILFLNKPTLRCERGQDTFQRHLEYSKQRTKAAAPRAEMPGVSQRGAAYKLPALSL